MRVSKFIAENAGISRRQADQWIAEGRVSINNMPVHIGMEMTATDVICVDARVLKARSVAAGKRKHVYIMLNKPAGITCTTEQHISGNIIDFIGHERRIFPIGRLDKESEGLILLTSNGDIVNRILRAENKLEKEYLVAVNQRVDDALLRGLARGGIPMHGQKTLPARTSKHGPYGFRIVLVQGLNRQIRLMAAYFGYRVKRLLRVRIGTLTLGHLKPGKWRNLTDAELRSLLPDSADW